MQTLLRSLTAILIPLRLQASGLPAAEATSRLGMLNGMVMPILMLPCVFTSALSMVALPRIAKAEDDPRELKRLILTCLASCLPVALGCTAVVYASAPFLANVVYRMADLTALFRAGAPLTALFALSHLLGSVTTALGQQKRSMYGAVAVSGTTLALTCLLAAMPGMRLYGVITAQAAGQILILLWNTGILAMWRRERRAAAHA